MLTDLQILGCELNKHAFGGRIPPRPAGGAIALPQPPNVIRGGRKGERIGNREGKGRERKGAKGYGSEMRRGMDGTKKGRGQGTEGWLDLDICPGVSEFPRYTILLTTGLHRAHCSRAGCCHFGHAVISYNVPYWS